AYTTTYYIFFLIQTMLIEIYIVLNQLTTTHVFADIPRYKGFRKPMQIPLKTALSEAIYFGKWTWHQKVLDRVIVPYDKSKPPLSGVSMDILGAYFHGKIVFLKERLLTFRKMGDATAKKQLELLGKKAGIEHRIPITSKRSKLDAQGLPYYLNTGRPVRGFSFPGPFLPMTVKNRLYTGRGISAMGDPYHTKTVMEQVAHHSKAGQGSGPS